MKYFNQMTAHRDMTVRRVALMLSSVTLGVLIGITGLQLQHLSGQASAATLSLCGNSKTSGTPPIKHVLLVMLENHSYKQVVGNSAAPFQTSLTQSCGVATAMFGATHTSAANYLALSAGEYPAASPPGCGSISTCHDNNDNLYHQLETAGLSWKSYQESMNGACSTSGSNYKIGHNPPLFYTDLSHASCLANDLPVPDLTAQSGALWTNLQNQTLPSLSWVNPNLLNDGEGPISITDNWVKKFITTVQQSASYQSGNTAVIITYDEGTGADSVKNENCANQALDMPVVNKTSAHQDSCHVPFFVVYPYTPAGSSDGAFFDHYSVTKTIQDLFGLPYLAHANDYQTNSLIGHLGL